MLVLLENFAGLLLGLQKLLYLLVQPPFDPGVGAYGARGIRR